MKPMTLTMTAFGSYAEETRLNFADLQQDLFLICGETGAGKTTIFDAIMFALYGAGSGSDRDPKAMHSSFADEKQDTIVALTFTHGGNSYEVKRTLHHTRSQGWTIDAEMKLPDGTALKGAKRVTERCTDLLGFNAEQFRKVVMLAQGEFQKFLKAHSDERQEILKKLFDNADYAYYSKLLIGARDRLKKTRADHEQAIRLVLGDRAQFPEKYQEALIYGHEGMDEALVQLCAETEQAFAAAKKTFDADDAVLRQLNEQKGAAEEVNKNLDLLEAARARAATLDGLAEAYAARRANREKVSAAWRTVRGRRMDFDRTESALKRDTAQCEMLERDLALTRRDAEQAAAKVEANVPLKAQAEELTKQIAACQEQRPVYAELTKLEREAAQAERGRTEAEKGVKDGTDWLKESQAKRVTIANEQEGLAQASAQLVEAQHAVKAADDRVKELEALNSSVNSIEAKRVSVRGSEQKLAKAIEDAAAATESYQRLNQRYLAGQAELLADELRAQVEANGEGICKVCGSSVDRAQAKWFAVKQPDTPDKAQVERADGQQRAANQACETAKNQTVKVRAELEGMVDAAMSAASRLSITAEDYASLTEGGLLNAARAEAMAQREMATASLRAAEQADRRFKANQAELDRIDKQLVKGQERLEELRTAQTEWEKKLTALRAQIEEKQKGLTFDEEKALLDHIARLEGEKAALTKQIDFDQREKDTADKRLSAAVATLESTQKQKTRDEADRANALKALDMAYAETGLNEAAYDAVIVSLNGQDGEAFLKREDAEINRYVSDVEKTREIVERLTAQTAGKQRVDLTELNARLDANAETQKAAHDQLVAHQANLGRYTSVRDAVAKERASLRGTDDAWRQLEALARAAEGYSGEGGKVSFERFVIGEVFKEVLTMANLRLDAISSGRYELVHAMEGARANSAAGLELAVRDHSNGVERGASTLSGGESFFTSLALALGLSDVVQSRAGGQKLEALFIDEGFGSLDPDVLSRALNVLSELTEGNRLVGIISHVDTLKESIPQKIIVTAGKEGRRGSRMRVVLE